jgi:hypothetical protein
MGEEPLKKVTSDWGEIMGDEYAEMIVASTSKHEGNKVQQDA